MKNDNDTAIGNAICTLLSIKPTHKQSRLGIALTCKRLCSGVNNDDTNDTVIGRGLIMHLDLKVKGNGRVDTDGGDKNPMGLARTIKRVIEETA